MKWWCLALMWCSDFGKKNDNEGPRTSEDIKLIIFAVTFQITFLCCFILTLVAILFDPIMCQSFMILLGFIVTVTVVSTMSDSLMFCLFVNFYLLFGCCLVVTLIAHMNLSMLQPLVTVNPFESPFYCIKAPSYFECLWILSCCLNDDL